MAGWFFFLTVGVVMGFVVARVRGDWDVWPLLIVWGAYSLGMMAGGELERARREAK